MEAGPESSPIFHIFYLQAVVLALDLSQSMNSRSGVEDTSSRREEQITRKLQEKKRLEEIIAGMTDEEILDEGLSHLYSCEVVSNLSLFQRAHSSKTSIGQLVQP